MTINTICLTPDVHGVGGMVSFRHKLAGGLVARGFRVTGDLNDPAVGAVLVIGGTRNLAGLRRAQRRGVRIVQRLDGMNWLHRRLRTGVRHFVRAELGNFLLQRIRGRIANAIIYQSRFSKDWWERIYGPTRVDSAVVYNAVNLATYSPEGPHSRPKDFFRLLLVEGSLQGGYETGLETAVKLAALLNAEGRPAVRLAVAGKVADEVRRGYANADIDWLGLVNRDAIPEIDRSAHLLFSADLNAACPNSVIEALACGLPVVSFDTGALPELVDADSGRIVAYGGDPWQLDPPDIDALAAGALQVLAAGDTMRGKARERAEAYFGLVQMVEAYVECLNP